mgnify:CR=1 FL=1
MTLERFKAEEMKRMADERDKMAKEREASERDFKGLKEPDSGMMS